MASSSRLAVWSCLLLLASSATNALSVQARDGHWVEDDEYSAATTSTINNPYGVKIYPTYSWKPGQTPSPTPTSGGHHKATHDVNVGPNGLLVYDPPYISASPGDVVRFHFNPKNHTVTQSSFDNPCTGIEGGFRTGFVPVQPDTNPLPYREFIVPGDHGRPLWFYCGQVNHCSSGMVFAINPPPPGTSNSFEAFKEKAKHTDSANATPTSTTWEHQPTDNAFDHHKPAHVHDVRVGPDGKLVYEPHNVHAKPGDVIRFHFNPKNHTVTQSSFDKPCSPLDNGFKTGFIPVQPGTHPLPYRDFKVPDNHGKPLWFYCGQVNHCSSGMVFSINAPHPPAANSFDAFKEKAKQTGSTPTSTAWEHKPSESAWTHKPAHVHDVQVGPHGKLVYQPHSVHAKAGDIVRFHFNPKNHTVTQSSFDTPCTGIADGFKTGFVPVQPGAHPLPYRDFEVPDNNGAPLWFYCGQTGHCGQGMVFSINAPAEPAKNSFHNFKGKALATAPKGNSNKKPSADFNNFDDDDDDDDVLDASVSDNLETDAVGSSTATETLKKYAVAGLALLGLNALLALAAVAVGVLIYVKKNGSSKVVTIGAGRYAPVFDADKGDRA